MFKQRLRKKLMCSRNLYCPRAKGTQQNARSKMPFQTLSIPLQHILLSWYSFGTKWLGTMPSCFIQTRCSKICKERAQLCHQELVRIWLESWIFSPLLLPFIAQNISPDDFSLSTVTFSWVLLIYLWECLHICSILHRYWYPCCASYSFSKTQVAVLPGYTALKLLSMWFLDLSASRDI